MPIKNLIEKKYLLIFSLFILVSCAGNLEEKKEKWDQIYGYCDNPQRDIKGIQYEICKAKERAAGPDGKGEKQEPFSITEFFSRDKSNAGILRPAVNQYLWLGALDATSTYDLKIADNSGGFIQTEWINDPDLSNQRCLIKIQILSSELISTGVKTSILCETYDNENWASSDEKFLAEEKKLTLKILELAQEYSKINS